MQRGRRASRGAGDATARPADARRRRLLAVASGAVTLAAFVATTWGIGRWQAPARERALPPAFQRSVAQPVASPDPSPVGQPGDGTETRRAVETPARPADPAARRAAVAAAAEAAEEAARAGVIAAAQAADEPLEMRVHLYLAALQGALEASGDEALLVHRSLWTEHFLRIEAVQQELASLAPGARESALASIRREMGFDPEQIESLAERDAVRNARWRLGLAYMEERRRLEATWSGEALEEELAQLRERTFGHEARTIALEEADGFFRFERPRVYGRN